MSRKPFGDDVEFGEAHDALACAHEEPLLLMVMVEEFMLCSLCLHVHEFFFWYLMDDDVN